MTKLSKHIEENPNLRTSPQPKARTESPLTLPQALVKIAWIAAAAYLIPHAIDLVYYYRLYP